MPRPEKVKKVEDATKRFGESQVAIIADYRGIDVAAINDLRRKLKADNVKSHVMKNTFARIALKNNKMDFTPALLEGPSMFFFSNNPVAPAKILRDFAKKNDALKIKGGFLSRKELSRDDILRLASLPSREVLLAQVAMVLNAPIQGIVNVLAAPIRDLASVIDAVRKQKEENI